MAIKELPPFVIEGHQLTSTGSPDHPMRIVTRQAAGLEKGGWNDKIAGDVSKYFDDMAADWHTRTSPERTLIVVDALKRGLNEVGAPATRNEFGPVWTREPLLTRLRSWRLDRPASVACARLNAPS